MGYAVGYGTHEYFLMQQQDLQRCCSGVWHAHWGGATFAPAAASRCVTELGTVEIMTQINAVRTPTVPWTRASLGQRGSEAAPPNTLQKQQNTRNRNAALGGPVPHSQKAPFGQGSVRLECLMGAGLEGGDPCIQPILSAGWMFGIRDGLHANQRTASSLAVGDWSRLRTK